MCKEMPVIPVNKVVDPKRIIGKKWQNGVADTPPPQKKYIADANFENLQKVVRLEL
jgi:hypothetical protein